MGSDGQYCWCSGGRRLLLSSWEGIGLVAMAAAVGAVVVVECCSPRWEGHRLRSDGC